MIVTPGKRSLRVYIHCSDGEERGFETTRGPEYAARKARFLFQKNSNMGYTMTFRLVDMSPDEQEIFRSVWARLEGCVFEATENDVVAHPKGWRPSYQKAK